MEQISANFQNFVDMVSPEFKALAEAATRNAETAVQTGEYTNAKVNLLLAMSKLLPVISKSQPVILKSQYTMMQLMQKLKERRDCLVKYTFLLMGLLKMRQCSCCKLINV